MEQQFEQNDDSSSFSSNQYGYEIVEVVNSSPQSSQELINSSSSSNNELGESQPHQEGQAQQQQLKPMIGVTNTIVKKRAKKVSKFIQAKQRAPIAKLKQRQMETLLPELRAQSPFVYLFGDEIIELNYNLSSSQPTPVDRNSFSQFKKIRLVETTPSSIELSYESKSQQRSTFQFVIDHFAGSNNEEMRRLAEALVTFQQFSQKSAREMVMSTPLLTDEINSSLMMQKQAIFADRCYEWIKSNTDEDDFYTYTFSHLNSQSISLQNYKEGISNSLIALLGGDFSTIHQVALRQNGIHFMNSRSRLNMLHEKVNFLSYFNQDTKEFDFELITFDEITVPCKVTVQYFEVPICVSPTCQYQQKYNIAAIPWMKFYSTCKLLKFNISPNTILSVIETRQNSSNRIFDCLYEDFVYSTESEIFLETYYKKEMQKKKKAAEKSTICRFRKI